MRRITHKASARKISGFTTAIVTTEAVGRWQDDADGQGEQLTAPDCVYVFVTVSRVQERLAEPEKPEAHCVHV